jgi:glycosyltransferase involved in cell wall biosynthesis
MKILVCGYACDPFGGSEPGVGWTAVTRIAKQHEVCVITDIHNKMGWEKGFAEGIVPENVKVRFLRHKSACSENRLIAHLQSWLNYRDFTKRVLAAAKEWHAEENFDLCHQVTIAGWRMPSPLWQLPIPFVWGPIGGAGYIPPAFRRMLSPSARLFETLRDLNSWWSSRSRAFQDCIQKTSVVFAANEETETLLRPFRGELPLVRLPIVSISTEKAAAFQRTATLDSQGPLLLFAGGNMEGRKGVSIALRALAKAGSRGLRYRYTVAGGGPEIPSLRKLAEELGISEHVDFHPGFKGPDYITALQSHDVYFLPSFRESTPVTLLEAYLAGCFPVVADTSAQGEIVRLAGGIAVPLTDLDGLVQGLADALIECDADRLRLRTENEKSLAILAEYFHSDRYDREIASAYTVGQTRCGQPTSPSSAGG